ncbi:hypothetical protein [uncultured Pseudomonas sp.]|uniref:hypothetical protein n=1 Tax=uncultured Pseudomonas sp. TaxID=114707 RepID=UPI0030D85893|tara:strand:+ start:778 stop:996 length:219 start_codon:yes stop_codon:yes gene_type:complete
MQDRPWPVDYQYKGIDLKIDLRYPNDGNVPTRAVITAVDAPGICDFVDLDVQTYDEAVEAGKRAAEAWIDLR